MTEPQPTRRVTRSQVRSSTAAESAANTEDDPLVSFQPAKESNVRRIRPATPKKKIVEPDSPADRESLVGSEDASEQGEGQKEAVLDSSHSSAGSLESPENPRRKKELKRRKNSPHLQKLAEEKRRYFEEVDQFSLEVESLTPQEWRKRETLRVSQTVVEVDLPKALTRQEYEDYKKVVHGIQAPLSADEFAGVISPIKPRPTNLSARADDDVNTKEGNESVLHPTGDEMRGFSSPVRDSAGKDVDVNGVGNDQHVL